MKKSFSTKIKNISFPIVVEKDEDGFYVAECTIFQGCYSQGKSVDEALKNIREVISLCLKEKENQEIVASYHPQELSLHTITL
jgi:predicted RNase H-like HicB family nuclease